MSYKASVSNIYELLDEEGGSIPQVNLGGDDKGPTKKATATPAKAQQQQTKPKQETPKASERPAQQKAPRQERSIDRRPPKEFSSSPKAGEEEEGKQQRRTKEGGERRLDRERGAGRGGAFVPRGNKRPFDRRSGTGRGREDKKGGAGKGNWGTFQDDQKVGEEVERQEEKTPADTEVQPQGEQPQEAVPEQKQEQQKEPEEEEDKTRTLDDFLKSKSAVKVELPKARQPGEGVDTSEWKGFVPLKKDEEDLTPLSKKGEAKKKESKKEVVPVNQVFNIPEESPKKQRGGRDNRGGFSQRGGSGGRGGKRGGQGRAAPNVQDESAFPALATKA